MAPCKQSIIVFICLVSAVVCLPLNDAADVETDHHYYKRTPHAPSDASRAPDEWRSTINDHHMETAHHDRHVPARIPKRTRVVSEPHHMRADDLRRAARRSRNRQSSHDAHEQQNNHPGWFNSFAKMLGIGKVSSDDIEQHQPIADERRDYTRSSHDEYTDFQQHASRAIDRHDHPADFGIEDDSPTGSGSQVSASRDTPVTSTPQRLSTEQLSEEDLKDLVHLFRRMFTALDKQLNGTQSVETATSDLPDVDVAIAEAQAANRRRETERRSAFGQETDIDDNDQVVDNEEMPPGSPAYESRKRLMRALSAVKDGADTATHRRKTGDSDSDHLIDAMSAGIMPYV